MRSTNGKIINSKIKVYIYISENEVDEAAKEIQEIIAKYLIQKCGAGNFLFEMDVQY
jgi:hypothetical protein